MFNELFLPITFAFCSTAQYGSITKFLEFCVHKSYKGNDHAFKLEVDGSAEAGLSSSVAVVCSSAIVLLAPLDKSSSKTIPPFLSLLSMFFVDMSSMCLQVRGFPAPLHSYAPLLLLSRPYSS